MLSNYGNINCQLFREHLLFSIIVAAVSFCTVTTLQIVHLKTYLLGRQTAHQKRDALLSLLLDIQWLITH